jgi:1,4-alpha-glucan branching enzyme
MVLHAHLPFIRYPEHEYHLEENWFYEAITETYIPLISVLENLINDDVEFRITLSLSPTLIEMFNNDLLRKRYQRHIENLVELSEKEIVMNRGDASIGRPSAFRSLLGSGSLEIITSAATHAYLPALMTEPVAARVQIQAAAEYFKKIFGKNPGGIWLPECGYTPALDAFIKRAGFSFYFLESHSLLSSAPRSIHSIYAPAKTPSGTVAFARDIDSSKQVWSSLEGYPGDFAYRDFYRDIGFDRELEYVKPYLPGGVRTFTGIKYYSITGKTDHKEPYVPEQALNRAETPNSLVTGGLRGPNGSTLSSERDPQVRAK